MVQSLVMKAGIGFLSLPCALCATMVTVEFSVLSGEICFDILDGTVILYVHIAYGCVLQIREVLREGIFQVHKCAQIFPEDRISATELMFQIVGVFFPPSFFPGLTQTWVMCVIPKLMERITRWIEIPSIWDKTNRKVECWN